MKSIQKAQFTSVNRFRIDKNKGVTGILSTELYYVKETKAQLNKFEDLIDFIRKFMNQAAFL